MGGFDEPNYEHSTSHDGAQQDSRLSQGEPLAHHASQIGLALQDLAWLQCRGRLHGRGGYAMTTTLLQVNPQTRTFVLEGCRTSSERDFMLSSGEVHFSARLRGAPIRFPIVNPRTIKYQGELACSADFPEAFEFAERRRQPRVMIDLDSNYTCRLQAPDGRLFELGIDNLSQTGVGLRSMSALSGELPAGTVLHGCTLDFGAQGVLEVSLQAAGHGIIRRHAIMQHLVGCTFIALTPSQRTFLQRLVYQFEMSDRDAALPSAGR